MAEESQIVCVHHQKIIITLISHLKKKLFETESDSFNDEMKLLKCQPIR